MGEFNSIDDFLNHSGGGGGNTKNLNGWNKNKPPFGGEFNSWLVVGCLPRPVWRHPFVEVVSRDDRENPTRKLRNVWMRQYVCREPEATLKKQNFRTPEGYREHPPKVCPDCILREVIRGKVIRGEIRDTDVVFEFKGSDKPAEDRCYHAGGFAGMWKRELPKEEADRLAQHGIFMNDAGTKVGAWAENFAASLGYLLVVVNNDDPASGVLVTVEREAMGNKIKETIADEIKSNGKDLGNPFVTPYCIQWSYSKAETNPQKKYTARRINMFPLTPAIEALIRGPHPDVSREVTPPNLEKHRTLLEQVATIPLPWDAIFKPALDLQRAQSGQSAPVQVPVAVASPAPPPPAAHIQEPLGEPCDCGAPMFKSQTTCGKCGAQYQDIPDATPAAAPTAAAPATPPVFDNGGVPF